MVVIIQNILEFYGKISHWHESSQFLEAGIQNHALAIFQVSAYFYIYNCLWINSGIRGFELIILGVKSMSRFLSAINVGITILLISVFLFPQLLIHIY